MNGTTSTGFTRRSKSRSWSWKQDGWLPYGFNFDPKKQLERLHKFASEAGRDPAELSVTLFAVPPDREAIERQREGGVDEVLLKIPDESRDEILKHLDVIAPLAS